MHKKVSWKHIRNNHRRFLWLLSAHISKNINHNENSHNIRLRWDSNRVPYHYRTGELSAAPSQLVSIRQDIIYKIHWQICLYYPTCISGHNFITLLITEATFPDVESLVASTQPTNSLTHHHQFLIYICLFGFRWST